MLSTIVTVRPGKTIGSSDSNILSATGLPASVLRSMIRRDGLFGADSNLGKDERAIVQSRLVSLPGLRHHQLNTLCLCSPLRLQELCSFVDSAILGGGEVSMSNWNRALRAGLRAPELLEILGLVADVRLLFGPSAWTYRSDVTIGCVSLAPEMANAA